MYKADYADDNFEVIYADNDKEAMKEAEKYESEHGIVFNVFEIDEEYNEVRTIYYFFPHLVGSLPGSTPGGGF